MKIHIINNQPVPIMENGKDFEIVRDKKGNVTVKMLHPLTTNSQQDGQSII